MKPGTKTFVPTALTVTWDKSLSLMEMPGLSKSVFSLVAIIRLLINFWKNLIYHPKLLK